MNATVPQAIPYEARPEWNPALRVAFRFVFSYLVLSAQLGLLGGLPGMAKIEEFYERLWQVFLPWVITHVLRLGTIPNVEDGGGDSTASFVRLFATVALALVATLLWTLVDRRRREYRELHAGLRLYVRYLLGFVMFHYGMVKIIQTQFLPLGAWRLEEQYGDLSPMGLLWTFMSYSLSYNIFTGGAEALGGLLLFFRRTTALGALLLAAVLAHVVLINFSYDVIVKIYSSTLLLLSLFLLAPDLRRLADLLVWNRPTAPPAPLPRRFDRGWLRIARQGIKYVLIGYVLVTATQARWAMRKEIFDRRAKQLSKPAKTYVVEEMIRSGRALPLPSPTPITTLDPASLPPASPTEATRWRSVTLSTGKFIVTLPDFRTMEFSAVYDPASATYAVWSADRRTRWGTLACSRPDADHLRMEGTLGGDSLALFLHRLDLSRFRLMRR